MLGMLRFIFVVIYLTVDILYVLASKSAYEGRVKQIQGSGYANKPNVMVYAGFAYACMALAWWVLVAERIHVGTTYLEALKYSAVLALAMYGVFNGTLYVMFEKWDMAIALRDTLWGVTWLTVLTTAYVWAVRHFKN